MSDQDYIDLYHYLYPFQGDPLLWVHLNTDYPYTLQGILFFPQSVGRADWEKGDIRLYCNQVYVSDSIKEIVPRYLLPLRGVIDSPDIPLNVSRSALQTDRKVRSIGNFVAKKVADRLKNLKKDQPEQYAEAWDSLAPFVKIGAMEDEKFAEQVSDLILFTTTADATEVEEEPIKAGEKNYTTLLSYQSRLSDPQSKRILYCTDEVAQAGALSLWKSQGAEVVFAETVIDSQFLPWLEATNDQFKFQRVDAELDESLRDEKPEISDQDGETQSESIRNLIKEALSNDKVTIQVQALKGGEDAPPAMILLPEQMRRMNDMGALMDQRLPGLPDHHVLLINRRHPLVEGLLRLSAGSVLLGTEQSSPSKQLASELALHLYDMARLGVGGLEPNELAGFQTRSAKLMSELVSKGT